MDEEFPDLLAELAPLSGGVIPQSAWDEIERRDKTRRERLAKIQTVRAVLTRLTPAQRAAVDLVYLKVGGDLHKDKIARRLGISIETLRDRLDGACKKFRAAFPQHSRQRRRRRLDTSADLVNSGFYRKSSAKQRAPAICSYPDVSQPWAFGELDNERQWTFKYARGR
jgi:DNA-binding CsgD family transcriptional regulator